MLDLIKIRYSPRAFSRNPVEPEKLEQLFEAARWAASAFNEQPWRFIYTTRDNEQVFQKMLECLIDFNREWVKNVPVVVLTLAKKSFSHNGKTNTTAWYDLGQSVANLAMEATALGLHIHQMSGFSADKARELFRIPPDFDPVTMIAIGYKGDPAVLPEDIRKLEDRPRERKPLDEILFRDKIIV